MTAESGNEDVLSVIPVMFPDDNLGKILVDGGCVAYRDARFGVTSGEHQIMIKFMRQESQLLVFYLHVPYAYPMPDGVKEVIKSALESEMHISTQKIEFINAGTEFEKKDIQFKIKLGD